MANKNYWIINPSRDTDVTANGLTAKAARVTKIVIDPSTHASYVTDFLAAGCGAISADDTTPEKQELIGRTLESEWRDPA